MVTPSDENWNGAIGADLLAAAFARYAHVLTLYARQLCDYPEDVVQEAFIELAAQPRAPTELGAWLHRVVRNRALTVRRSTHRRTGHEAAAASQRPLWFEHSPAEVLDGQAVAAALETLPQQEREILVARIWGGLTFQQIAALVGVTDSTVHRRYQAALTMLRERLRI